MGLSLLSFPSGATFIHFGQDTYNITSGEVFDVQVFYDADSGALGDQIIAGGLLTMGVRVVFDGSLALVASTDAITLPAPINSDGLGGLALKTIDPNFAAAAGALGLAETQGYMSPLLATFQITDTSTVNSENYTLGLDFLFSDGLTNFVDFATGSDLDPGISFGAATVNVIIPEPTGITLMTLMLIAFSMKTCGNTFYVKFFRGGGTSH